MGKFGAEAVNHVRLEVFRNGNKPVRQLPGNLRSIRFRMGYVLLKGIGSDRTALYGYLDFVRGGSTGITG